MKTTSKLVVVFALLGVSAAGSAFAGYARGVIVTQGISSLPSGTVTVELGFPPTAVEREYQGQTSAAAGGAVYRIPIDRLQVGRRIGDPVSVSGRVHVTPADRTIVCDDAVVSGDYGPLDDVVFPTLVCRKPPPVEKCAFNVSGIDNSGSGPNFIGRMKGSFAIQSGKVSNINVTYITPKSSVSLKRSYGVIDAHGSGDLSFPDQYIMIDFTAYKITDVQHLGIHFLGMSGTDITCGE